MNCGVGSRRGSDPVLLWLWRRLEAAAPIRPLAWEPPYAMGVAQEMAKKTKEKKDFYFFHYSWFIVFCQFSTVWIFNSILLICVFFLHANTILSLIPIAL